MLLDIAQAAGVTISRIIDDAPRVTELHGIPTSAAGSIDLASLAPFRFLVGIGNNEVRQRLFLELQKIGTPLTLRHPFSCVSPTATIGHGVVIMPGVVVNTGAKIGDNVILNTSCSVDHDCEIGAHSHLCPGVHLAGNVTVGPGTMIGTGTAVIPGVCIGANCTIGAGAVVVRDMPNCAIAYGSPCRVQGSKEFSSAP